MQNSILEKILTSINATHFTTLSSAVHAQSYDWHVVRLTTRQAADVTGSAAGVTG